MSEKELFTISGTVMRKLPPQWGEKNGRKFARNTFIVKPHAGGKDLFVTSFKPVDGNLITQDVTFQATKFNETSYTLQGEINVVKDAVIPDAPKAEVVTEEKVERRGRPKKTTTETTVRSTANDPSVSVSDVTPYVPASTDVLDIVAGNIADAQTLITKLNLQNVSVLDLADMVGRTRVALRIEAGKDRRMDSFRK